MIISVVIDVEIVDGYVGIKVVLLATLEAKRNRASAQAEEPSFGLCLHHIRRNHLCPGSNKCILHRQ